MKCDKCGAGRGVVKGPLLRWEAWRANPHPVDAVLVLDLHAGCVGPWMAADGKNWLVAFVPDRGQLGNETPATILVAKDALEKSLYALIERAYKKHLTTREDRLPVVAAILGDIQGLSIHIGGKNGD